jgi:predicted unusual protein kinase regulating ubiquinone biosynthesis (AarF/ABC1/UbiB family)
MTAVVFGMLGLTIGVGLITSTIWKAVLANMILHFIWDRIVTLVGRKDLMLQIPGEKSKIEQITIPKQESKEDKGRNLSQEEIYKYEQILQKEISQDDIRYQYQPNPEIKKDIEEIFNNLLNAMVEQGKITTEEKQQYRIHYYYSSVANAYTVTNSKDVFIFSELIYELVEEMHREGKELTKDHIAAILAHELQHTIQENRVYDDSSAKKGDDKRKEYDADREAVFILEQAEYNPRAVEETMTALSLMSDLNLLGTFFDAHPDTKNRLKEISEILEDPSLVFLSMTKEQQKFSSSVQKYGQDFQKYLGANFKKDSGSNYSLEGKHLQQILDETEFFEQMSIFDMSEHIAFYNKSTKDFVLNNILNGNYKFFTKAENDFIKNCSDEEKEVVFYLLFSSSIYNNNKLIEKLENRQKKDLFDFCIDILKTVEAKKIENKALLSDIVSKMNPTEQELKKFLDFRMNNEINLFYSTETAYFWLTNYKYLSDSEINDLLESLMISDPLFGSEGIPDMFVNFSQEQKEESLKLMLKILLEKKSYYPYVSPTFQQHSMHFINFFMRSSVLTKQEKFEFLFKLSKSINNEHKEEFNNFFLNLFDELHSDKTNIEKILYLFEIFDDYYLSDVFSYDDLMDRYDISNHDFSVDELRKMALSTKYLISRFDVFFLGYFLKLHNKDIKIYFVKDEKLSYDKKYSDGICLYHGMDVENLDKSLFRNVTLNDLMDFQNFMLENNCWCQNISCLMCFIAEKVLNLSDIEKIKLSKILTFLPKGQSPIEKINGDISSIPYEHLKNLVDMRFFYKDINEQTRELPKFKTETSFVAFYVPFLEFKTFKPNYSAVSFEKTVENIKNHFDAYSFFQELRDEENGEEEIKIFISLEDDIGNPDEAEQRIKNTEIEKAWLVELHRIFELSPKEKNVEFNYEGKQFVYTYFELDEQLFNDAFVPTAQQAQQLINAFSIIKRELPQETVDVYAKLVYSLLKRNSSLSVFSSAKDNLELLDLLFEDFSAVKDGYITELLDNYNVTVEEYRKLISKTRLYSFGSNSEKNNENVTNLEIINTILPTLSDSEKISFFFWLLSGNDSYKPQMLKQIRPINFDYEGEINFDSLRQSFRLIMTKTERENFIRKILLGNSGIIEKGKTTAEKNSKEFEQGLKNILFDDFFLSSFSSSKIKASSMSIVFKDVFSIVFNNLSDERKVLFVNNLISSLAEIKNSDEKDTDEQKARQLGKLIVALGASSGVMVVKLLQILSNNRVFEALDEKYGSIINEEVAKVKSENEPLSKSVLFQYLEKLGVSSAVEYVGKRLGSASIGITYLLKLKNMSELVVAKIKRPNINKNYSEDFKIADKILEYFKGDSSLIPSIYKKTLPSTDKLKTLFDEELEFEKESENLKTFNEQLKKRNSKIRVPQLVETVDGIKVYTQNLFLQTTAKGKTLDKIKVSKKQKSRIYFEILKEFFTEVFVDPIENGSALYHADLHTGNIFVDEQGNISFIDLGGVGNISAQQSKSLKNIFMYMYSGNYENFINALKSYNSKLYKDLEQANALKKTEEILNRKTSLESKFVDLFEIFNSLENIDSDFMMFIQAISKISSYLDNLGKKEQLLLLNNLSFKKGIQFKIISDSILTAVASIFKRMRFGKKQKEDESYEVTQEDMFREKLLSNYPDISSEKIDLLLSLDPFIMEYIKNNTVSLTQEQLIKGGILADKFYKQKIITEQNNKMNILFKILSTTDFSEQNIEKLLSLDENTIERIISEITENKKIEVLFIKSEQLNIELIYKNDDLFKNRKFDRILMFAKGTKLNRSQDFSSLELEEELKKANMLFSLSPETILKENLLEDEIKLFSLYSVVKGLDLSLEEDIDIIEILAPFSADEINYIDSRLTISSRKSKKDIKRFIYLYNDYRNIFSKKGEAETLSKFVENNENDEQIREFFDLAIKNKSIGTIKNIAHTSRSFDDIILSSEFALGIILFRCKALGIPIDENNQDFADMLKSLKNISYKEGQERISSLDEEIYKKLFSIRSNDKLMELLKYISAHDYNKIGLEGRLNKAFLEENLPERFIKFLDDYNQFEHMENLPSFAFTDTDKRETTRELYEDEISKLVSEKYQFEFAASTKYLYVLQNRNNKDELLDVVSREDAELKFKLLALMYLVRIRRGLTQEEMNVMTVSRDKIITEFKKQLENNSFRVSNNFDLRSYMMGIYLLLQDDSLNKPIPKIIYNAFIINTDGVVLANSDGFFARVDLFTIVHELTHVVVSKPGFYSKLVADTVDELVSYVTPNMFLAMAKLSFKAYSKVQTGYTMHQTKGVIDYVKMGKKLHVLYNLFSERTIDRELIQEEHSAPIAFLELLFNAHANVGKMVDWNILLEAIKTMDDENLDQSSVFEDVLYTYTKMLVAKDKLTKKETDKLLDEMEKMQMWTLLSFDIVQNIKAIDPDTYSKILGNNNEFYFGEQILSNPAKTKEQLEKFSNVIKSKEQLSKDDILILLITDIISEVDYEQLINNFDGVIEGIINVVKGTVQIFDMQKENYSLSEYEQISEYVKDNYNISTSPITAVKEKIFDFISNSLNKAFFAKLLLNKVFGIKDLNNIMKEKKLLIVTSKQQEQNLKQKLQEEKKNNLENTEIVTMEIITEPTKIIRSDMILDIRNGIRARYDAKENKLIIYSKRGVDISEEQIQSLIMQEYFAERSEDIVTGDVIAFANKTDSTAEDILNRLKTAYTYSVTIPNKEIKFDLSHRKNIVNLVTVCNQEFAATGRKTFVITLEQAKEFVDEIKQLREQDFKFIISCKYNNVADVTDYDGLVINATEIKDINQATKFMESLKKKVLKQGLAKQISIKFNDDVYSQFESLNRDILNEFGISPIVNAEKMWNVGKCEVENITEKNIEQLLRNNLVTGIVINNARVFVGKKGIIRQLFSKEHKYNKGYNASLNCLIREINYVCFDVKKLKDILSIDINNVEQLQTLKNVDLSKLSLSSDSQIYLKILQDRGYYEEMAGFIRGIAMNSARTQIVKGLDSRGISLDMEKFAKEANGKYQKALLTVAVQLMMEDVDITELLDTDFIESDMTVKEYLDSVLEKVNINIGEILKHNEYKIEWIKDKGTKDKAKTIEDFKNYVVLFDNLKIVKDTTAGINMSIKAVRSMLSAA